jgi:hypothetical protein
MELYLESGLRDLLGIGDSLLKKTRREVVEGLVDNPCRSVLIRGRTHTAYPLETVQMILSALCSEKARLDACAGVLKPCETVSAGDLASALVQGPAAEIEGKKIRADLVTLRVQRITKNRLMMLADDPSGKELSPVRLKVRDTEKYVVGMMVPGCRQIEADLWVYAGREPRSRGRW